jgi:hypothetical protein
MNYRMLTFDVRNMIVNRVFKHHGIDSTPREGEALYPSMTIERAPDGRRIVVAVQYAIVNDTHVEAYYDSAEEAAFWLANPDIEHAWRAGS